MCVVQQGSVLGALLCSIYVNDLLAVSETCSRACYVDDTKLILSFPVEKSHAAADKISDDLQRIRDWSCFENYLLLNRISQNSWCLAVDRLFVNGKELLPTDSVKDLGVIFDFTLTFAAISQFSLLHVFLR